MALRFGMVGTGKMAKAMIPAFSHCEDVSLVAICSSDAGRARGFASEHGIDKSFGDLGELLKNEEIDAVYVANNTGDHAATAIKALNADKHVLCEKPFATSFDDAVAVIEAAKQSNRTFMEAVWIHFLPAFRRISEAVSDNELGKPSHLAASFGYPQSPENSPRLFNADHGGVLLDLGTYPLSLALSLFGAAEIQCTNVKRNKEGVDLTAVIQLRHDADKTSQLHISIENLAQNNVAVSCENGLIAIPSPAFGAETVQLTPYSPISPSGESKIKSVLKKSPLMRKVKQALSNGEHHPYGVNQYLPQMRHFSSLVNKGQRQSEIVSHDLSLSVLKLIDDIRARQY